MIKLRQGDPQWGAVGIGNTNYTLSRWGCTINCISMLSDYYGCYADPSVLAKKLKFTANAEIYWQSIKSYLDFEFVFRFYTADYNRIDDALLGGPETSVILQVDNSHWVVAIGKVSHGVYKIADPIDGKVKTTKSYNRITGGATFKGKVNVPESVIHEAPIEDPIITWHKENKIMESWDDEEIPEWKLTMAWAIYKGLKENKENKLNFDL